jgi:putative FmdB family regulatory protein
MPIYEYSCVDCKTDFELLVRGTETALCPDCGGEKLEKKWSTFASSKGARSEAGSCAIPNNSGPCCGGSCHGH